MTSAGDWLSEERVSHLPNGHQCADGVGHRPGSVLAVGVGPELSSPYTSRWSGPGVSQASAQLYPAASHPRQLRGQQNLRVCIGCRLEQARRGDESGFEVGPGPPAVLRPKQPFLWPLGPPSMVPAPSHACHNSCAWDQQGHVARPNLTEEVGRKGAR